MTFSLNEDQNKAVRKTDNISNELLSNITEKFISPDTFKNFTYSKKNHFDLFKKFDYDKELFGYVVDPEDCDLKIYQDLLIFSYLKENLKKGSKILDLGGGDSRILKYFKNDYECWNIDKLEGVGNGPKEINSDGFRLVNDYMGNFNKELQDNYFDLVFSISTLEHAPIDDYAVYENIKNDINRVLKPGGYSVHCLDILWKEAIDMVWTNKILYYLFENEKMINDFVPFENLKQDSDLYSMSEKRYEKTWQFTTQKPYKIFGRPISYNFIWKKPAD